MATHRLSKQQAFDLLSLTSQNTNVKVVDIAANVVAEGDLPAALEPPLR